MYKSLLFAIAILSLNACKSTGKTTDAKSNSTNQVSLEVTKDSCPDNGSCDFEVRKSTSFTFESDNTGAMYPKFEKTNGSVIVFKYTKKGPEGTADGDYSEQIYFNVPNFRDTVTYTDAELGKLNVLFNKQCFCRGEAGYYPVKKGTLKLHKNPDKTIGFELDFEVPETSQRISSIKN